MQLKEKAELEISAQSISNVLTTNFFNVMNGFYEMQSSFLSGIYKRYQNIETATIVLSLAKNTHLTILREREKNMDHDISIDNFWKNFNTITKPSQKIVAIVDSTGIPKETTRRKIKLLISKNFVEYNSKTKEYNWILLPKHQLSYRKIINDEINSLSKFVYSFSKPLNLSLDTTIIKNELELQFCFYWYHFLSSQLRWLKMWQDKIKDIDLLFISLQAIIPTLQYLNKENFSKSYKLENIYKIIGKIETADLSKISVGAASISDITGIPRATCVRKLCHLVKLGLLEKETKSKRFFINQQTSNRTKNILTRENINFTINNFSNYLYIILNALIRSRN
tara:strand:- start:172 stop:1185 length:1014 start_codon:yes stop_codon:yes gene_type:complete